MYDYQPRYQPLEKAVIDLVSQHLSPQNIAAQEERTYLDVRLAKMEKQIETLTKRLDELTKTTEAEMKTDNENCK